MGEIEKLTVEILELMEGTTPEEIEDFKSEWLKTILENGSEMYPRVIKFVETICEVAAARARRMKRFDEVFS